jgi:dihydrofolate synthase / folylpolyglutamate synthase
MNKKFDPYQEAVDYIESLADLKKEESSKAKNDPAIRIKRVRHFLKLLKNPEKGMQIIQVTGTAGKGSFSNLLNTIFFQAGLKSGLLTSPAVSTTIERISVGDKYIDPLRFAVIVQALKPVINKIYVETPELFPSYFELILVIALLHFKNEKCKYVILEAGIGGRFDATNFSERNLIAVVTNVNFDHSGTLGNTLQQIAWQKAGVIKEKSIFWTAEQDPALLEVFAKECEEKGTLFNRVVARVKNNDEYNSHLAYEVSRDLGIAEKDILKGIQKARMPARFEPLQISPLVIVDGAHNQVKMKNTVKNLEDLKYDRMHLVFSIAPRPDLKAVLTIILKKADSILLTKCHQNSMEPKDLLSMVKALDFKGRVEIELSPSEAVRRSIKLAKKSDLVLITGSFYLAGYARKLWYPEAEILRKRSSF